jgi:hypothetical protein
VGVLSRANLNVPSVNGRLPPVLPRRSETRRHGRLTPALREHVAAYYTQNEVSALNTAEHFGIGKSTVLKILKASGAEVRPQGRRIG